MISTGKCCPNRREGRELRKIRRLKRIKKNTLDIGIDRVIFKTLNLKNIDAKLLRRSFCIFEGGDIYRVMLDKTGEELKVNCIKVKSSEEQPLQITSLSVGVKKIKTMYKPYEYLDVNLPRMIDKRGLNVNNINSLANFKKSLKRIEEELKYIGFSDVDLSKSQIEEIEINVNVPLQRDFDEYKNSLKYIESLFPKMLRRGDAFKDRVNVKYSGFLIKNNSVSVKFYDKRKDVMEKHSVDIGHELLRIEYRLMNAEKVKAFLGTIEVNDLLKNFDAVAQSFKKGLEKDLISKIQKDIDQQIKYTVKTMKDYKKMTKSAIDEFIKNEKLLDVEILLGALKEIETVKNYSREAKKAIESAGRVKRTNLFGNVFKLNELLELLGYDPIEITMTQGVKKLLEQH